jgi:hypothetical protein
VLLFRYPTTLVYLQSAVPTGGISANFDRDPDADGVRVLPSFKGRIGSDVAFFGFSGIDDAALREHWLVLQEPPAGYRFANDLATPAATGHEWAAATLVSPVRVLVPGDTLIGGAIP